MIGTGGAITDLYNGRGVAVFDVDRRFFRLWFWSATHSRLEPIRKVTHMFQKHLQNIISFRRHRVTHAVAEGLNSKIMSIKRRSCGHRNKEHFKTAIYLFCGGLDLYPR